MNELCGGKRSCNINKTEMTDILCRWLNTEVRFDTNVTRDNMGQLFWNGLRFGQIMDYYQLQPDIQLFSPIKSREAAMRNFSMLRESLEGINIELSSWTMNELRSANVTSIRQLLYQMYIGLKKHEQQREVTG